VKITYNARVDALSIVPNPVVEIAESDEDKPGVILDYDGKGNLVSLEILDASQRVSIPSKIEYQVSPAA